MVTDNNAASRRIRRRMADYLLSMNRQQAHDMIDVFKEVAKGDAALVSPDHQRVMANFALVGIDSCLSNEGL